MCSKQKETWPCVNAGGRDPMEGEIKDTGKRGIGERMGH